MESQREEIPPAEIITIGIRAAFGDFRPSCESFRSGHLLEISRTLTDSLQHQRETGEEKISLEETLALYLEFDRLEAEAGVKFDESSLTLLKSIRQRFEAALGDSGDSFPT